MQSLETRRRGRRARAHEVEKERGGGPAATTKGNVLGLALLDNVAVAERVGLVLQAGEPLGALDRAIVLDVEGLDAA